jgi:hypothetical protein
MGVTDADNLMDLVFLGQGKISGFLLSDADSLGIPRA